DSDIQEVLFGNILSVDWAQIRLIGIIFGAIAVVHMLFYKKFYLLTESFESDDTNVEAVAFRKNRGFQFWNFIFYITIGLAIVFAVRTSGVIPVFSFLIIPAVGAIMLAKNKLKVTIFSVIISLVGAYFGLFVSFHYDFPAGSSLVAVLGAVFFFISVFYFIKNRAGARN
ncbi:MAG: metal ABC transporter permease, partial [Saprospiraceae bacterium]